VAFLWWRFGDPFLFYSIQEAWNRRPVDPLIVDVFAEAYMSLGTALGPATPVDSALAGIVSHLQDHNDAYSLRFLLVTVALFVAGLWVLPLSLSLYTLLLLSRPSPSGSRQPP
jgi:hypothetical protein